MTIILTANGLRVPSPSASPNLSLPVANFYTLDNYSNRPPLPFPHPTTHTNTTHTTTMASTYPALELQAVVGFGGKVPNGLLCHPDGVHLIYPLGSTIVVKNTVLGTQTFLQGHSNMVSCMELSRDGCKLASGQVSTSYCSSCQTTTTKKSIVQNT